MSSKSLKIPLQLCMHFEILNDYFSQWLFCLNMWIRFWSCMPFGSIKLSHPWPRIGVLLENNCHDILELFPIILSVYSWCYLLLVFVQIFIHLDFLIECNLYLACFIVQWFCEDQNRYSFNPMQCMGEGGEISSYVSIKTNERIR